MPKGSRDIHFRLIVFIYFYGMKKNTLLIIFCGCLIGFSCKHKEKTGAGEAGIIPVLPYIKSQLAMIDTSLYSIKKIEVYDTLPPDTLDIPREQVRLLAQSFTDLPDISLKKFAGDFTQIKNYYEDLNRISFVITPVKPSAAGIQKQEIIILPDSEGGKMNKIIIDQDRTNRDSSVKKNLIWQAGEYFQVTTIRQLPGQPEKVHTLKVTWTDFTRPE
jgi:hypothetical protein